jgi:integrase
VKLTAITVRTAVLPAAKSETIFFDDDLPGFGLRLREGGGRSFVFQYKLGAKQRRMSLGTAHARDVGDVRKAAEQLYHRVKLGEDPAGDRTRAVAAAAQTFEAAANEYLEQAREWLRKSTYPDVKRYLLKHCKPLHQLSLGKVARADVASVLAAVSRESGGPTGNRLRTSLSSFFSWAMQHGRVEANPVVGTPKNKERPRDRVLSAAELGLIWEHSGVTDHGKVIRLLILTGQRASEIANLLWSEIHGDVIILPRERVKNGRLHTIPLSGAALDILAEKQRRGSRDLIFGKHGSAFSGWGSSKEALDQRIAAAKGKPLAAWVIHDIRRSVVTHMAEIGVQPHIIEAVINHVSGHKGGVAGIYNRASYEAEKRTALNRWAAHLTAIVGAV